MKHRKNSFSLTALLALAACAVGPQPQDVQVTEGVFQRTASSSLIVDSDPVAAREAFFKRPAPAVEAFPWYDLTVDETPLASRGITNVTSPEQGAATSGLIVDPDPVAARAAK